MSDSIQSWLNAAGRFPLLPKSELIRLAKKRDTLTPGSRAYVKIVNKITQHNLRLVPNVVRKYLSKRIGYNMTSEVAGDLLQQGYLGLRRAAEKYDGTRGFTFSTYAYNWIYQSITRWHNCHDRAIYVPENAMTELLYIKRNGMRSKSKNGTIGEEILNAASRTMDVTSIDRRVKSGDDETTVISDLIDDSNRLISNKSTRSGDRAERMLRDLMIECGIKSKTQEVVITYAKRGRMAIVAARLSLSERYCRNLYQEAVRVMKSKVGEKDAAKVAALADRLKSNDTTSTRD